MNKALAKAAYFLISTPLGLFWQGLVLMKLWGWYIAPKFGLPSIDITEALGIMLIAAYLTHQIDWLDSEDTEKKTHWIVRHLVQSYLVPAMSLLMGWAILYWAH